MQTSHFLGEHGKWQQISVANTAIAAKKILDEQDRTQAAVCSADAAGIYGLEILQNGIMKISVRRMSEMRHSPH